MAEPDAQSIQPVQAHIVHVLAGAQILGGIGVGTVAAVGALLAGELSTESLSGLAATASVIGAAVIAIPVSRVMNDRGRRPGLLLAYAIGILGAFLVVTGAVIEFFPIALLGLAGVGGGTTAGMQSRYAAADLAAPDRRGRDLATVVWATTIGSVLGPNLASPVSQVAEQFGIPELAGPYLLTIVVFSIAAFVVAHMLRPDPLITARALRAEVSGHLDTGRSSERSVRKNIEFIFSIPTARLGLLSMSIGQAVMGAVMAMTTVHLKHGNADLQIIGLVISIHIAGMYVASPLVGMASDRFGRRPVILAGCAILLTSFVFSGTASPQDHRQLSVGLFLLGLGWSCTLIAGSTLLTESIPTERRPTAQGSADLFMGMCSATAGLLAGLIVGLGSYGLLNLLTTLLVIPLVVITLRPAARSTQQPAVSG